MNLPMSQRIEMAINEMKGRNYHTMNQLAESLQWSESTVQRVCGESPELLGMLSANKKRKPPRVARMRTPQANLHPIVKQLRELIDESGMSYKQIAAKAGMSEQFFRDVFVRGHLPRLCSLLAICGAVGLDVKLVRVVSEPESE